MRTVAELTPGNYAAKDDHAAQIDRWEGQHSKALHELRRRIDGIRLLLGDGIAHALERPLEDVTETAGEATWHRDRLRAEIAAATSTEIRTLRSQAHAMHARARQIAEALWTLHDVVDKLTEPGSLFLVNLHDADQATVVEFLHRLIREHLERLELRRPGEEEPF